MTIYQHQGEKVYFDSCCISRKYDDLTYANVKAEADMIQDIIDNRFFGGYTIIGSAAVIAEIRKIRDVKLRRDVERLYYGTIADEIRLSAQIRVRARKLRLMVGLGLMDATHLAAAEAVGADYLLTTDIDFIGKCARHNFTNVNVINPLNF